MGNSILTERRFVGVPKRAESRVPVEDICREFGVSPATFFRWRWKYGARRHRT